MDPIEESLKLYDAGMQQLRTARTIHIDRAKGYPDGLHIIVVRLWKFGDQLQLRVYINGMVFTYPIESEEEFEKLVKKWGLEE